MPVDLEVSYTSSGPTRPSRANPTQRVCHCNQSRKTHPGPTRTRRPQRTRRPNQANRTGHARALHYLSFVRALNYQNSDDLTLHGMSLREHSREIWSPLEKLPYTCRNPQALFGAPMPVDLEVSYTSSGPTRPSRANPTQRVCHCNQSRKTHPGPTRTRRPQRTRRPNQANRTGHARALHYLTFV